MAIDPYSHFKKIISSLDDSGVKFSVVGGIALGFYGIVRATKDIDLLILPEDSEKAIKALNVLGYRQFDPTMSFEEGRVVIERLTYGEEYEEDGEKRMSFLKVDLLIAKGEPYLSVLSERRPFEYEGRRIYVASRKGLIQLKKLRGSEMDLLDIKRLSEAKDEGN